MICIENRLKRKILLQMKLKWNSKNEYETLTKCNLDNATKSLETFINGKSFRFFSLSGICSFCMWSVCLCMFYSISVQFLPFALKEMYSKCISQSVLYRFCWMPYVLYLVFRSRILYAWAWIIVVKEPSDNNAHAFTLNLRYAQKRLVHRWIQMI